MLNIVADAMMNPPLSSRSPQAQGIDSPKVGDRASVGALAGRGEGRDSHDHLLAGKQGVADELAGAQSNLSVGHFCE